MQPMLHNASALPTRAELKRRRARLLLDRMVADGATPTRELMSLVLSARPMYGASADPFEFWQPTTVSGFVLDIDAHFNVTIDSSTGTPCVATILNRTGASDSFANGNTSLQPVFEANGWVGSYTRPSMLSDGANDYLLCTTSMASTLVGGNDTAFSLFAVGQHLNVATTNRVIVNMCNSASTADIWDIFAAPGTSQYTSLKRDHAATAVSLSGGTPDTAKHCIDAIHSGTNLSVNVDGTNIISASQNVGSMTVDRMVLFATFGNSVPANFANYRLARLLAFTGALTSTDADYVRSVLTSMYF